MTRQARGRERRAAIVAAAGRVLIRDGVAALTHRAVAAEAGVPLGSTTYYFADRPELVRAAVTELLAQERERRAGVAVPDGDPSRVAERLTALVIPPAFPARSEVALLYERLAGALRDPELALLLRADAGDLRLNVARLLGPIGLEERADMVASLLDGRVIQWLGGEGDRGELDARVADDLRWLAAAGRGNLRS
ncbi:MAG: TetR family transcriptional regulator [Thermoleophilia bacterium]|nr:TetR family transcriptional regulator [Thermoleophilia bacterium]